MLNAEQIRAARALLDWSTAELAKRAGLTVNGINKIERGHVNAQRDTLESIQKTFEDAGLEFLPGSGLRKKDRLIEVHEGKGAWRALMEDVLRTLRDVPDKLLRIAHVDEGEGIAALDLDFLMDHIRQRREMGVVHRLLVRESDTKLIPPLDTYHVVPDAYFAPYPFYIYGPKLALVCWREPQKIIIVNDERFAESVRKIFDFVWDRTDVPGEEQRRKLTRRE